MIKLYVSGLILSAWILQYNTVLYSSNF